MAFNQIAYNNQYNREHYARLSVQIPKEDRPIIDAYWKKRGYKSFNAYINDLIRKDMNENDKNNVSIETINQNGNGTINIG